MRRWSWLLFPFLVLLLLVGVWLLGPNGPFASPPQAHTPATPAPKVVVVPSAPTAPAPAEPQGDPDCRDRLASMVDDLDDETKALWQTFELTRGAAERVAGPPQRPGTAADESLVRSIAEGLPDGFTEVEMDCSEWPCALHVTYPASGEELPSLHTDEIGTYSYGWGGVRVIDQHGVESHRGTTHRMLFAFRSNTRNEAMEARMRFRGQRAMAIDEAEGTIPELVPPPLPDTLDPDPCGDDARLLAWLADDPEAARSAVIARQAHHAAVAAFMGGQVIELPASLDARYQETAVQQAGGVVADTTGLELAYVDCAEFPCMAALAGKVSAPEMLDTELPVLLATTRRALSDAGYAPNEVSVYPGSVRQNGRVVVWISFHPGGERPDPERASQRRDENGWPRSDAVFDPLPPQDP